MAKQGNNMGTVVKRADGRWMASITVGYDENGRQRRRTFYGKTEAEANRKRLMALGQLQAGTYVDPNRLTTGQWLDTWLSEYVKPALRPRTYANYEGVVRVHIKPLLGGTPLSKLQASQVQFMVNEVVRSGRSARTAGLARTVIHAALKQAVANGLMQRNVADGARKPKGERRPIRVLTLDEQRAFLSAASGDRLSAMMVLLLGTGLRLGEAVALRWQDVDLPGRTLRVSQSASRVSIKGIKSKLTVQPPKTKAGRRSIPLPQVVVTALQQWRRQQLAERLKMATAWKDTGLVFTTGLGTMLEPRAISRKVAAISKKARIKHVNVHALRHTCATRLLEDGVPVRLVQEILGHTSSAITSDIYQHVLPELKQTAADAMDRVLRASLDSVVVK